LTKKDLGSQVKLSNSHVTLTLEKATAKLVRLTHNGQSLLAPREVGYFTLIAGKGKGTGSGNDKGHFLRVQNCTFRVHLETSDIIDVAFLPEAHADFPLNLELHYVLRKKEAGFYFYLVASKEADATDARITQFRWGMRLDPSMLNIRVNDERAGVLPTTADIRDAKGEVMDATYLTPSGKIVTKYSWSTPTCDAPVYGLNNEKQGVWMIRGGSDYLCGGPTKQHNTCHATNRGPILLNLLYSNHYGCGGSYISAKQNWKKVFGPTFVYLNLATNAAELWKDAKQQAETLQRAWPYTWMVQDEYPTARASVAGLFQTTVPATSFASGSVVLARPREFRGLDWQKQGGDSYIYRSRINKDGSFLLPAVREGSYTLYAFAPGILGEFRKDNLRVKSGQALQLGTLRWASRSLGKQLWRIGNPDRTAAEFRHGDNFRHWGLWFNYRQDFPNDVNFDVGKSQERTDWNYAQMAVWEEPRGWKPKLDEKTGEGEWKLPVWKIRFPCEKKMRGKATLTLALAGVNRQCDLEVALNGKPLGTAAGLAPDSSIHRSGIYGFFRERFVTFDASKLQLGENCLTLKIKPEKMPRTRLNHSPVGIMYDFIQLEVDN